MPPKRKANAAPQGAVAKKKAAPQGAVAKKKAGGGGGGGGGAAAVAAGDGIWQQCSSGSLCTILLTASI